MNRIRVLLVSVGLLTGCSGSEPDSGSEREASGGSAATIEPVETSFMRESSSTLGARCAVDEDCESAEHCKSDFPYERLICSAPCEANADCPLGASCVEGLHDYNEDTFITAFCMIPCETDAECPGSECDDRPADSSFCF